MITKEFTVLDSDGKQLAAKGYADASQKAIKALDKADGVAVIVIRVVRGK